MKHSKHIGIIAFIALALVGSGCKKFLETNLTNSELLSEDVYNSEKNATSVVAGIYRNLTDRALTGGGSEGISNLTGLSSDELHNALGTTEYLTFEQNNLVATDMKVSTFWMNGYQTIFQANDVIENVSIAKNFSTATKDQLIGEALFVRAFCHFYLVNIFGDIPVVTRTDYGPNALVSRTDVATVYQQIITDLQEAQRLLPEAYALPERVRANKATATALLARAYLYTQNWSKAAEEAGKIISDAAYIIEPDLNKAFLKESKEVIWQMASTPGYLNTTEGISFIILYGLGSGNSLITDGLLNSFETGDLRKDNWIGTYDDQGTILHFPYKFKSGDYGLPITEHYVVFRLAEQYLIRAEARAQLDDLDGAIADVDTLRKRAGLPLISDTNPGIGKDALLLAIEKERRAELFTEWGHRWFDLKRTGRAMSVLGPVKTGIKEEDLLYPVPQTEFNTNPKLGDQNPGY